MKQLNKPSSWHARTVLFIETDMYIYNNYFKPLGLYSCDT